MVASRLQVVKPLKGTRQRGVHSSAQLAAWEALFRAADLDMSDSVTFDELSSSIAHSLKVNQKKKELKPQTRNDSPQERATQMAEDMERFIRQSRAGDEV